MRDLFVEIWESLRRNKLRTCLTGFAVAWGIFMLIVLLGAGNGLMNAFLSSGGNLATNMMAAGGGWVSKPYAGYKTGRYLYLQEGDVELTKSFKENVDEVAPTLKVSVTASRGDKFADVTVEGNYPQRQKMEKIKILHGRFINNNDLSLTRKVLILPENLADLLLGQEGQAASLIGQYIKLHGMSFMVVGICETNDRSGSYLAFAPYSTIKTIWNKWTWIDRLYFTFHGLKTQEENAAFEKKYKAARNLRNNAAPDDESATWVYNNYTQDMQMSVAKNALRVALWIIGIFTLMSGIVGVSNIMLITVKERTHEFGIRKAIGAKPWSITKLIVSESIFITGSFGYLGMVLGLLGCEVLNKTVGGSTMSILGSSVTMFKDPFVGVDVAIGATILLIAAGTLAGLIPALKAAKVRPIEALRAE